MKRYPKYKDSGIGFLNEIPAHWEIKKIKYLLKRQRNAIKTGPFGSQLKSPDIIDFGIKVYNQRNVLDNNFQQGENYISLNKFQELRDFEIFPEDILMTTRGTIGKCAIFPNNCEKGVLHPCLIRIQIDPNLMQHKFLLWFIQDCIFFKESIFLSSNATTIDVIYSDTLKHVYIPFPPFSEQQSISNYLNQKTNQIDTFIQKKQKQVDLLKEYRTAIINDAVIKGLNPNVKMKDSGIEWLGEIPEHWKTSHLKFLCSLLKDGTHQPPSRVDEGIPLLSVRNIVNGKFINLSDDSMISIDSYQELKRSFDVKKDDILLAIVGATLGKTAIVENMSPFFIQRSLAVFRPLENLLHFKYLFYFFQATTFQQLLWKSVGFSAQPGIYLGTLSNFTCPLPDIEEQHSIVSYLDCKIARIDALINKINKVIEKLIEYRTSLISEVITGKIDIRDKVQVPSCVPNPT